MPEPTESVTPETTTVSPLEGHTTTEPPAVLTTATDAAPVVVPPVEPPAAPPVEHTAPAPTVAPPVAHPPAAKPAPKHTARKGNPESSTPGPLPPW